MRSNAVLLGIVPLVLLVVLLGAASGPKALATRVGNYTVSVAFVDGLPYAGEPTRAAISVVDEQNHTIPNDPAILYVAGGANSYQLQLDHAPTTIVTLPALDAGDYQLRIQLPGLGATGELTLSVAKRPLYTAKPVLGGVIAGLGLLVLLGIVFSDRFKDRGDRGSKRRSAER